MDMAPEQHASSAFDVMMAIKQEPEMASGQHTSSICDSVTIKQEPVSNINVEADTQVSPKQEVEYISVKEEPPGLQEWEVPECHSSAQDPLSFTKEECSPSEDYLGPVTYNIVKTENEEDEEEAASEDDGQELKNEMESTSSEPESTNVADIEDCSSSDDSCSLVTKVSLAAETGSRIQSNIEKQSTHGNKTGTRHLAHHCHTCKKTFQWLQDLKEHTCVERGEAFHFCNTCHKTFTTRANVKRHLRLHTGERPFSCGVCNKTFSESGNLKKHSQLHTGERPYSCVICNKTFTRSAHLRRHSKLHTGERPFSCSVCNKTFMIKSNLDKHFNRHTGKRPYSCGFCNLTFTLSTNLNRHLKLHTGQRPYSCGVCNMTFITNHHLKRHSQVHTGKRPLN
ncbi:zinc finger protein 189-like isoform X2 [Schistocerca serialis cubense]|uniref:zinc finger protein 189-like isoform X2 n=1 Tax=Schistocerca serialis cubense TaxID=2023355 RepID=UPI00214E06DC|nr:zinc finger protein 189-like isoform X2 [Schistocerca serialis cubense]